MSLNILRYETDVWRTADYLRGAGIKESDFPKFMMPYFALIMVESRLIRQKKELEKQFGELPKEDFIDLFKEEGLGYNKYLIEEDKGFIEMMKNDKNYHLDFNEYLRGFDPETRYLLGVDKGSDEEKFLDISGVSSQLFKKGVLFQILQAWSEINLTPFSNSEITTLEEHIKRKWADISAETAGEQYTPDDIISLISEIIVSKIEDNGKFVTIYDPTCGGGNLLFGVEDKIQELYPNRPTATFGQEWNDTLYALAKIESRFRRDTQIEYGNTLTAIGKFWDKLFSVVVANPPYGVDWKGFEKDIKNDTTQRFVALPSISDGQLLFTQHILSKLADDGLSIVVHNGSTLFSGDAGSGESTIRKHFFDQDYVEAIIQMPTDEFFNTGIYTYLWIFNKNKTVERKDKVILINASDLYEGLKKTKGKKRKQMNLENRAEIVKALSDFQDNSFARVFDKWNFYYNKQSIMLTNIDEDGNFIQMPLKTNKDGYKTEEKSIKLGLQKLIQINEDESTIELLQTSFTDEDVLNTDYKNLENYLDEYLKPLLAEIDYKEKNLKVYTAESCYCYDNDKETIIEEKAGKQTILGCGKIVIKANAKKDSKTKKIKNIAITVELTKDLQKDYEIITYSPNEVENQNNISAFMKKYITKPFEYLENVVGVEINFNKVFYELEKLRSLEDITYDLSQLEKELNNLEKELGYDWGEK